MGASASTTNDSKGPVQVNVRHTRQDTNVKPTRRSQLRCKSPLQRPSSSLSISSKSSLSPFSVLPPVTSRHEISDGRPTSGSKNRKTSRQTQSDEEGSVYLPDIRKPLPDIRITITSNAGSSDMMKTTYHRSQNHGRPSLQPLDSIQLMRENGPRRHRRNRNGVDFTQSGYNKSDLEIAVQASLAISEEQQSHGGEDNVFKQKVSELDIRTFEMSERFSDQEEIGRSIINEEEEERNVDLTQSGYDKRDLDIAVQMSLAIPEELFSDQEEVGRGITNEERKKEDPSYLLDEEWTVGMSEEDEEEQDNENDEEGEEDFDPDVVRNEDLTQSGYEKRDLDIAVQMSLAIPEELFSDQEEVGRGITNKEWKEDPSYLFDEKWTVDMTEEEQKEADDEDNEERVEDFDQDVVRDEERTFDMSEEEQEEPYNDNDEEEVEDFDPDISKPIEDILSEMRGIFHDYGYITLRINRSFVWRSALEQFRQENFSPADGFSVTFVDDDGKEEGAYDAGGPKREYFQLMMDHLANCSLFEGPPGRKLLSYDVQANRRNEYFYAGMVIGQSLLYGGPVPRFLSPLLLECLILEPENVTGSRGDIYDSDWLQLLDEVQKTDCVRDFVLTHNKTMYLAGCLRNENMGNKAQLIQDLINYYLVERTRPAFDKFKQGLDSVRVYEYIRTYPKQFRELFSQQEPLTAEKMSAIFTICYSYASSEVDENASDDEESKEDNDHDMMTEVEQKTTEFWKTYLSIVEAGGSQINLENILMFATGMKEQQYGQYPKIYFNHPYFGEPASKYPTSSTCSCALYLPLHDTFEEFKEAMDFGILNGSQFGNA